jgi:methylthioribose-1-phosphate isomerase
LTAATTIDTSTPDGSSIVIEERDPDEVLRFSGSPIAPAGVAAANRAFDVTPAALVTAYVTDAGVFGDLAAFLASQG